MYRRHLLCAVTGVFTFLLPSGGASAETLRDAVQAALASHPAVDIVKAQKEAAHEDEREQVSNLFPEIGAGATGGRVFANNATSRGLSVSRGEAYSWLWEGSGSITQPIFNGFETYNRIDAAKARETAADFTLADARQGLALRAALAFLNVERAQEAYQKANSYQDKIEDYARRIGGMVEAGAADESESAQAKNIQAQLDNTIAEMDGQVKLALADYVEATGAMPTSDLRGGDEVRSVLFGNVGEAVDYAKQNHPLILSSRKQLEAEDEDVSAEKGTLLPDLDGEVSYLKRDQKEEIGGEVVDNRAVMRMNWGFSTGGGQLARIRKAKAERSEALARLAQTQREIERDIRRAYAEYDTATKQKELTRKRAQVTKELLATYEKQFEASKVRILQLLQAENQLFTTELEQINSNYRVVMAEYSTLASAGRLLEALNIDGESQAAVTARAPEEEIKSAEAILPAADFSGKKEDAAATAAAPDMFESADAKPKFMKPILSPQDYRDSKTKPAEK